MKKRLKPNLTASAVTLALLSSLPSYALNSSNVNIAGFASIGYAKTIDADVKNDALENKPQSGLYSIDDEGDYRGLTKMGIRMDVDMDDKLSFAAQMIVSGDDDYNPEFDWLYASYQFNPQLALTVGRFIGPVFMYSDSYEVAYSYHGISLPFGTYNDNSLPLEGAKLTWETSSATFSSRATAFIGNAEGEIKELNGTLILDESMGISWEVGISDWLSLRAIHFTAKASLPELEYVINDPTPGVATANKMGINDQLKAFSAANFGGLDITYNEDDLSFNNERTNFYGIGAAIDTEYVFFNTEYTETLVDEQNILLNETVAWYALLGVRIVPTVSLGLTYTSQENKGDKKITENYAKKIDALPLPSVATAPLKEASEKLVRDFGDTQQETWTLGLRWDFHPQAALKLEYIKAQKYIDRGTDNREPDAFRAALNLVF